MKLFAVVVAALCGFQFGFNTANIAAAILFLTGEFSLTPLASGFSVGMILIGALFGSSIGGYLANRAGRKKTMQCSALIFILGCTVATLASAHEFFLIGRWITGFAVGTVSVVAPMYLAEIAPSAARGRFVASNQLAITVGILFAYGIGHHYAALGQWRYMIGWGVAPAALQFCLLFLIPESPAFVKSAPREHKVPWKSLFLPEYHRALLVGLTLSIFQQITGINAITYFAPKIFEEAGYTSSLEATFATVGLGIINVLSTTLSLWLIDRAGRRKLLFVGLAGMSASLFALVYTIPAALETISFMALLLYIASFALAMGPIPWIILSEIYPLPIRGHAIGFAVFFNWLFNYAIAVSFLPLIQAITSGGAFAIYGGFSVICLWFVWKYIPETKGKTFSEIAKKFSS